MRKQTQGFWSTAVLITLLGVVGWSTSLQAQQTSPMGGTDASQSSAQNQAPAQAPQQAPSPQSPNTRQSPTPSADTPGPGAGQPDGVQVFTGQIVKAGDKYVLQDSGGTAYDIDHQDLVKQYEGKRVRVNGTLDPAGKMIHIQGGQH